MMPNKPWWGSYTITKNNNISWNIGDRSIIIERLNREWMTWNISEIQPTSNSVSTSPDCITRDIPVDVTEKAKISRHLQNNSNESVEILPALADRSVVARPAIPIGIIAGESVNLYLSTPLWFNAYLDEKQDPILDIPFYRPSDSWFGPSTLIGEICYAKYTDALVDLAHVERRQHRAITPIQIINKDKSAINIERINVPVPLLSLYSDGDSQLWTNSISITYDSERSNLILSLGKGAPEEAGATEFVRAPRDKAEKNILVKSISSLFA